MTSEFNIGDIFHRKYTRDAVSIKVIEITYRNGLMEPEYTLKPIYGNGEIVLGEEALKELYWKVGKNGYENC